MTIWRVRTVFTGVTGSPWLSTQYFSTGGGTLSASSANAAVGAFWTAVDARMKNSVSWSTESEVVEIDETTGQPVGSVPVTPQQGTGTLTSDLLTLLQAVVRLRTGVYVLGREVRGRIFIPGLTETDNDADGQVSAAARAVYDGAAATLRQQTNHQLVVYSRTHGTAPDASSTSTSATWGYLSSRRD